MTTVIEVLQYSLKSGSGAAFHSIMEDVSVPLHQQFGIKVLRFGNSLHEIDNYYLVRSFESTSEMSSQLNRFYGDPRWKDGPREAIVNMICESHRVVFSGEGV